MADEPTSGGGLLKAFLDEPEEGSDLLKSFLSEDDSPKVSAPLSPAESAQGYMGLKMGPSKPKVEEERGSGSKGTEVFGESALNLPEGRAAAAKQLADGFIDYARLNFPEVPLVGRNPTKGDFEKLAKRDLRFAMLWDDLKTRQEEQRDLAKQLHGANPDWNAIQGTYTKTRTEDALSRGELAPRKTAGKKPEAVIPDRRLDPLILLQGGKPATPTKKPVGMDLMQDNDPAFDEAVSGFAKEAYEGPPGVTRPPITDDEILSAAWGYLHNRAADEMQTLTPELRLALKGAGKGVQLAGMITPAGRTARAFGGIGETLAPLIEGAMASAGGQALAVGSGAQKEFSTGDVIASAAFMGLGAKAGSALAVRYPNAQKTMAALGTLGTLQAGGTALELAKTGEVASVERVRKSATPLRDALGILIESGTEMAVGGALGAAESGRPRGKAAEAAEARKGVLAQEAKAQYRATEITAETLGDGIRRVLGISSAPRKIAKVEQRVTNEVLPVDMALGKADQEYRAALDTASAGDPAKRKALADAAILHIETGGKFPIPEGVPEQVGREIVEKARAVGAAGVALGEVRKNHNQLPEARYRQVTPEVKNRFTGQGDEQVVGDYLKSPTDDSLLEISRRVSAAEDPQAARAALTETMNRLAPDDAAARSYIEGAIEKGLTFEGAGRFGAKPGQTEPEDLVVMKSDFDRGYVELKDESGKVVGRKDVNREDAAAGKYGKLVGSYNYAKERGFYFPIIEDLETKLADIERGGPSPTARSGGRSRKPVGNALEQAHNKRRTSTFEEAFFSRKLDTSPESAMKVLSAQSDAVRKKAFMDIASEDGLVMTAAQLPDAELRAQAAIEASGLKTREQQLLQEIKQYQGDRRAQARIELNAVRNQLAENKKIATGNFFKKAVGKDWGEYEGMYMHPAVMNQAEALVKPTTGGQHFSLALNHLFKGARVGTNPRRVGTDLLGNLQKLDEMGIPVSLWKWARSWLDEFGFRKKDNIDLEFDAQARRGALGGQTATNTAEERTLDRTMQARAEAKERGASTIGHNLAIAVQSPAILSKKAEVNIPVLGKVIAFPYNVVKHFKRFIGGTVDISVFRAAYRQLREKGIQGSGPLGPAESFDKLGDYADYSKNPKLIRQAAGYASFLPYPSKAVQALKQTLQRQPRVLGVNITPMLDNIIAKNPGSKPAQAALVGRGLIRLATASAKWMGPVAALAAQRASALGISDKEIDKYIEDNYGYLPGVAKHLTRQMFIPTGRTPLGGLEGFDAASIFPAMYVMRYLSINFDSKNESPFDVAMRNIAGKNVVVSPIYSAVTGRGAFGKGLDTRKGHEFDHGGRLWPLIESISPAMVMNPLNAYFAQQNVPESERSALRAIIKESTGLPLTVLRNKNFVQSTMEKWYQDGVVDIERRPDGSWNYYVPNPLTPEGDYARWFIGTAAREFPDLFKMQMKAQRDMTLLKEAVQGER